MHSVQSISRVQLFITPWTAAPYAPLSFTISQSLLKLMSIESMMLSNHLILCHPLLLLPSILPRIGVFSNESVLLSGGQNVRVSASTSVLPMNTQDWSPLGWTGWISLQSKGHSRVFSNTTVQKHQFFGAQPSLYFSYHINTWLPEKLELWQDTAMHFCISFSWGLSWSPSLTKHGPLEKGMANHFSILALRAPWTAWKGKKRWHGKMNYPGW